MSMVSLSVLVLMFVVGHQISNATNSDGSDFIISIVLREEKFGSIRLGFAERDIPVAVMVRPLSNTAEHSKLYEEFLALKTLNEKLNEPLYLRKVLGYSKTVTRSAMTTGEEVEIPYEAMAMELLGQPLEFQKKAPFGMYTQIHVGIKLIEALQGIHVAGFILRVLNPSDIVLRRENITDLCITNFEFAKKAVETTKFNEGDWHFMSLNAHNNELVGKVQDLESLFYILLKFSVEILPWAKVKLSNYDIFLLKVSLFESLDRTDKEKKMLEKCGFERNSDIDALTDHVRKHPGLKVYAQVLADLITREKGNKIQNITDQDYVDLLAGFKAEMGEFRGDNQLDWAGIKNEPNAARGLKLIEEPKFKLLDKETFRYSSGPAKGYREKSQGVKVSSGGGEVKGGSEKGKKISKKRSYASTSPAEEDPTGDRPKPSNE